MIENFCFYQKSGSYLIFHKENVLVETDKEFNVISRFTRGYEVVTADIAHLDEDSNLEVESKLNRSYYTVDELGSTVLIIEENQSVKYNGSILI